MEEEEDSEEHNRTPEELIGFLIDERYRLDELLGGGTMGTVYRAEQVTVGRDVAVKVLRPELSSDPRVRAQFEKEARAVAKLRDPNCITLFDYGYDDAADVLYMVFNYVDGVSLRRFLGRAVPLHGALSVILQVASALEHAHSNRVLHRDLKPANIMVEVTDRGDRARVLDFGLAQIFGEADSDIVESGGVFGSPAYMSPAQCRGEHGITGASDIYSLGCIGFELIEGRLPFEGTDPLTVIHAHKHDEPPKIKAPGVPFDVVDLIGRMLSKDPGERPTANEVVTALVEHVHVDVSLSFALGRDDRKRNRQTVDLGADELDPVTLEFDPGAAYGFEEDSDPDSSEFALDFAPPRLVEVSTGGFEELPEPGLSETTQLGLVPSEPSHDELSLDEISMPEAEASEPDTSLDGPSDPDTVELSAAILAEPGLDGLDDLGEFEETEPVELQNQRRAEAATIEFQEESPAEPETHARRPSMIFAAIAIVAVGLLVMFLVWNPAQPVVRVERTVVSADPIQSEVTSPEAKPAPYVVDFAGDIVGLAMRAAAAESRAEFAEQSRSRPQPARSTRHSKGSQPTPKKSKRRRPAKLEFRY